VSDGLAASLKRCPDTNHENPHPFDGAQGRL